MAYDNMIKAFTRNIHWLGHAGFRIDGDKIIYFDPYQIKGGPLADVIFVSHDHFDHCSPEDIKKIQGPETIIVTEKDSAGKLNGDVRVIKPGETLDLDGIKILGAPSYNTDKDFHPRKNRWLGFLIELSDIRIYHAGDTDFIPEMKEFNAHIALLPVSGIYVMSAEQAVKAALAIGPEIAIPMHYGTIVGENQDAVTFKKALNGEIDVRILEKSS